LWIIEPNPSDIYDQTETKVARIGNYGKCEALEFAFGDDSARIKVPNGGSSVVPDSWTADGGLFGFDDDRDAFLIINPSTGAAVEWPSSFNTIDAEGFAFTTRNRDSWGVIVVDACD